MENTRTRHRLSRRGRRYSPTRERVLRLLEAQPGPVTVAAVATVLGLHGNTVRSHLDELHADGYLCRTAAEPDGRGRPAWLWETVTPVAPRSPYAGLASALAHSLAASSEAPVEAARAAGLAWGAEIAEERADGGTARESVVAAMRDHGFDPTDHGDRVVLHQCPLIEAATAHPEIVCAVHQGVVDRILDAHGEPGRSRLHPFTAPGECTLHLPASP